jgi:hypothetical protein
MYSTKCLGLAIDNNLCRGFSIQDIAPELNKALLCNQISQTIYIFEVLRMINFSLAHLIISYGIIFWGASLYSKVIFKIQRRISRVIVNSDSKDS